jgi:hypothetical protein
VRGRAPNPDEIRAAYERGAEHARIEALPFEPISEWAWMREICWQEQDSRIDSYLIYERRLLEARHALLAERERREQWIADKRVELELLRERRETDRRRHQQSPLVRRAFTSVLTRFDRSEEHAQWAINRDQHFLDVIASQIDQVRSQRTACQQALDRELAAAETAAVRAAALRREPAPVPHWVIEYQTMAVFISDDPRRALPDHPHRKGSGGADYGYTWTLEDPDRPWVTTTWRISWLIAPPTAAGSQTTNEIYAAEYIGRPGGEPQGRVWLFGELGHPDGHHVVGVHDHDPLMRALEQEIPYEIRRGRNSLLAAADALRELLDRPTSR